MAARLVLSELDVGEVDADGLVLQLGRLARAGDDADLAVVHVLQRERDHRPADVDLAGHGLRIGRRHAAGRGRLRLGSGLTQQREQDQVRRRARRRECDGLAVGVLQALDRAVGLDPPEQLVGAGHLGRDDPVGRGVAAFHVGADRAEDAVRHGDVDAAGHDRGHGLGAAFGVEHFDLKPRLLEEAGGLAELDPGAVPESLLRDRDLQLLRLRVWKSRPQ